MNLPGFDLHHLATKDLDSDFQYSISTDPDDYWVKVGEIDVTSAIRESAVAESVSAVARIPEVRAFMKRLTHGLVERSARPGVVVEGRDITTVVAPDAEIKILLTASEAVRLKRRSAELSKVSAESVKRQVSERDASDSKVVDFMTPAPGVQLVDSSDLNFAQTVEAVIALVEQKNPKESND
jgi:cytidylate kinase